MPPTMATGKAKGPDQRLSITPVDSNLTPRRASGDNCFRRSPRLISTPEAAAAVNAVETPAKNRASSKSDALALSLHVVGFEVNGVCQPTPLKMYDPNFSDEKRFRRSSRFTTNKYRSVTEQSENSGELNSLPALSPYFAAGATVRRLPRLSAGDDGEKSDAIPESNLLEWKDTTKKRQRCEVREVGGKCLRSRTVPMPVDGSALFTPMSEPPSKRVKTSTARADVIRRSPRLSSPAIGVEQSNADVKCNLLALPEPPPSSSSEQSSKKTKTNLGKSDSIVFTETPLRSKVPLIQLFATDEHADLKSALIKMPDVSTDRKPKERIKSTSGSRGSGMSRERCLRSVAIPTRLVKTEDVETKIGLTESPNILENKKNSKEIKTTPESCNSDGMTEKCLRSRKVPFCLVGTQNEGEKRTLKALLDVSAEKRPLRKIKGQASSEKKERNQKATCFFLGEPVPDEEARERWRWRYELKSQRSKHQDGKLNAGEEDEIILNVECHFTQAKVGSCIYNLGDCAYIKGNERQRHVGRLLEFFKTTDGDNYFRVQWFFRAEDTVIKKAAALHDKKRLFYSTITNDNLLECIISKVSVIQVSPMLGLQLDSTPPSDYYCDMEYCVEYSTFRTLLSNSCDLSSPDDIEASCAMVNTTPVEDMASCKPYKPELALLDLYSGCGGMSTGLCLGAKLSSVNLVTRWAVDAHKSACDSLKLNHAETQVRHETMEGFLELLKGWERLCQLYVLTHLDGTLQSRGDDTGEVKINFNSPSDDKVPTGQYEVLYLVDICCGDPCRTGKPGLKFKVRWKGYGPSEDTWEPIEGLSNCQEHIQDFVRSGFKSKILPLPGDVDVLCGGPPCQGISGYNRFRNVNAPLDDDRNHQIVVFMDIVQFLRPKYVLMENVVDILKFDKASLARYALSRLVHMKYQARLGTMAAGCYGLPQFRLRVFLYGALPSEKLPQFPLPTHDVVVKYWPPSEFERNTVAYDEGEPRELEDAIILRDAISDLPAVTSHEIREQMTYEMPPETEFQQYIRSTKDEMMGIAKQGVIDAKKPILHDHRPYQLSEDDYLRVCQIPHKKGANFRDLPGVVVGPDNVVHRDPTKEQMKLPSGKPMVPDYAFTFEQGKSKRPFARLWWDETVGTVVTFPSLHNQAALHPEQDRVLTIREYARLQGFPDYYRFCGTVKERYCQVGNAVAVPVARALGYAIGMAIRKLGGNEPLMTLPPKFAFQMSY